MTNINKHLERIASEYRPSNAVFAVFDSDGRPLGFYNEAVHGKRMRAVKRVVVPNNIREFPYEEIIGWEKNPDCLIPDEAVEISEDHWLEFIENNGRRRMCEKTGKPVECEPVSS